MNASFVIVITNDGLTLQDLLKEPFKFLRMCTFSLEDFCKDVVITKTLSDQAVVMIIESIVTNNVIEDLSIVCNTIQTRNVMSKKCCRLMSIAHCKPTSDIDNYQSKLYIDTTCFPVLLMAISFETYRPCSCNFECKVSITRFKNRSSNTLMEPPIVFPFKKYVKKSRTFEIPLKHNSLYIKLLSNSNYLLSYQFKRETCHTLVSYVANYNRIVIDPHGNCIKQCRDTNQIYQIIELSYRTISNR